MPDTVKKKTVTASAKTKTKTRKQPKLSPSDIRVLKAKVKAELNGLSQNEAAKEAYPNQTPNAAAVSMTRTLKKANVQDELQKALIKHGITADAVVKPIADGLQAVSEQYTEAGIVTTVDHSVRLRASSMGQKLLGLDKKEENPGGNTFNFINAQSATFNAKKYTE